MNICLLISLTIQLHFSFIGSENQVSGGKIVKINPSNPCKLENVTGIWRQVKIYRCIDLACPEDSPLLNACCLHLNCTAKFSSNDPWSGTSDLDFRYISLVAILVIVVIFLCIIALRRKGNESDVVTSHEIEEEKLHDPVFHQTYKQAYPGISPNPVVYDPRCAIPETDFAVNNTGLQTYGSKNQERFKIQGAKNQAYIQAIVAIIHANSQTYSKVIRQKPNVNHKEIKPVISIQDSVNPPVTPPQEKDSQLAPQVYSATYQASPQPYILANQTVP